MKFCALVGICYFGWKSYLVMTNNTPVVTSEIVLKESMSTNLPTILICHERTTINLEDVECRMYAHVEEASTFVNCKDSTSGCHESERQRATKRRAERACVGYIDMKR